MFRKITAVSLAVSFAGMASSGALMVLGGSFALQFRLLPVHKLFAPVFITAGLCHLFLNRGALAVYLKERAGLVTAAVLAIVLAAAYAANFDKNVDEEAGQVMDQIGQQVYGE
ncbi:MAG: hypothetical protein NDI60_04990 [Elusimicrobiales bacterium]|nr:hypothetical protein [Elusimicrobiales bacterium]